MAFMRHERLFGEEPPKKIEKEATFDTTPPADLEVRERELEQLSMTLEGGFVSTKNAWGNENLSFDERNELRDKSEALLEKINSFFADKNPQEIRAYIETTPALFSKFPNAVERITDVALGHMGRSSDLAASLDTVTRLATDDRVPKKTRSLAIESTVFQIDGSTTALRSLIQSFEKKSTADGARLLSFLDAASYQADHPMNWLQTEESVSETITDAIQSFARKTTSPLLRRKSQALLTKEQGAGTSCTPEQQRQILLDHADEYLTLYEEEIIALDDAALIKEWKEAIANEPVVRRAAMDADFKNKRQLTAKENVDADPTNMITPISSDYLGIYEPSDPIVHVIPKNEKMSTAVMTRIQDLEIIKDDPKLPASEQERRKQAQRDYALFLDPLVLDDLEKDFGVPVRDLTLREQVWFATTLRDSSKKDEARLMALTQRCGIDAAKAFLSVEHDAEFREQIFSIGEGLPKDMAIQVFKKYADITAQAQTQSKELTAAFFKDGQDRLLDARTIERELLKRGQELLVGFAHEARLAKIKKKRPKEKAFLERLERYESDIVLFASMFKTAKEGGIDFHELQRISFETVEASELSKQDVTALQKIFTENWSDKKEKETYNKYATDFKQALEAEGSFFHVLRRDGRVMSFVNWQEKSGEPKTLHGDFFNVRSDVQGAALGETMFRKSIETVGQDAVLQGEFYPEDAVGMMYVERMGFCAIGVGIEKNEWGVVTDKWVNIERDQENNGSFRSRQADVSLQTIQNWAEGPAPEGIEVISLIEDTHVTEKIWANIQKQTTDGKRLTRFVRAKVDPKTQVRYLVFEAPEAAAASAAA